MFIFPGKQEKEKKIEQLLLENYNRYYRLAMSYVHNESDAGILYKTARTRQFYTAGI